MEVQEIRKHTHVHINDATLNGAYANDGTMLVRERLIKARDKKAK